MKPVLEYFKFCEISVTAPQCKENAIEKFKKSIFRDFESISYIWKFQNIFFGKILKFYESIKAGNWKSKNGCQVISFKEKFNRVKLW